MKIQPVYLACLAMLVLSCSSARIIYDYDKTVDFSQYKTYMFLPWNKENSKLANDFDKARLYAAVEEQMNKRGYQRKEYGADMAVNIMLVIDKKTAVTAYTDYYNGYGYYYPFGLGYTTTQFNKYDYWVGTLVIDIFEVNNKKLIWQGAAVKEIDENPRNKEAGINRLMNQIFYQYPVKPQKK